MQRQLNYASIPSFSAVSFCIVYASAIPCFPVQALAFPELTMIACIFPVWYTTSFVIRSGAALMAFVVKTPATLAGTSLKVMLDPFSYVLVRSGYQLL